MRGGRHRTPIAAPEELQMHCHPRDRSLPSEVQKSVDLMKVLTVRRRTGPSNLFYFELLSSVFLRIRSPPGIDNKFNLESGRINTSIRFKR